MFGDVHLWHWCTSPFAFIPVPTCVSPCPYLCFGFLAKQKHLLNIIQKRYNENRKSNLEVRNEEVYPLWK